MTTHSPAAIASAVNEYLTSRSVPPTVEWLQSFTPSIRSDKPFLALQKTALFRLLSTDLTETTRILNPSSIFPPNASDPAVREQKLPGPITVQVLDVEDIGRSRWFQVEDLEAVERGETTKGREVIRVVADDTSTDPVRRPLTSIGPHKLLLQDAKGNKVYGFETESVKGVNISMAIGTKLVLRNLTVARGVILIEPKVVEILGGKVEAWDSAWREGRKERLKRDAGMSGEG